MDPLQELRDEHRLIERVLQVFETAARHEADLEFFERVLDFLANFAEASHHAKEEDRLFPLLDRRGVARAGGPVGLLLSEHRIGRGTLRRMRELLAAGDRRELRATSLEYCTFVREHIRKEESVLFEEAAARFSQADLEALDAAFRDVEAKDGDRARCLALAHELTAEAGGAE